MSPSPSFLLRHPSHSWIGKPPLVLALLLALARPVAAQDQPAPPACSAPEHRAFDFWVGEWDVFRPDGSLAGRNAITRRMGGCVLHESYTGWSALQSYHGESFNVYDATRGVWHQTWVDGTGLLLLLEGGIRDGAMVLEGTIVRDGAEVLNRITWTVLDGSGGRVRQHWETSTDGGASWSTAFDGEYRRRGS